MTRHRWILHHVTLYEAALYARELSREARLEEFRRQTLYQVVNRSLGGEFEADRGLLEEKDGTRARTMTQGEKARNWIKLSKIFGVPTPPELNALAKEP